MRLAAFLAVVIASRLPAQVTADDYRRAEQFLPGKVDKLIANDRVTPHWFSGSDRFWYRIRTVQGPRFKIADPVGRRSPMRSTISDSPPTPRRQGLPSA
jgi:hypothetical protein